MIKFKIDENLPQEATALLCSSGLDALSILDQQLGGEPDSRVSAVCMAEGRALLTLDLDFSDIRNYPPDEYAGLIVLRLARQDKASVLKIVNELVPKLRQERLTGRLWIVDETSIRIRE